MLSISIFPKCECNAGAKIWGPSRVEFSGAANERTWKVDGCGGAWGRERSHAERVSTYYFMYPYPPITDTGASKKRCGIRENLCSCKRCVLFVGSVTGLLLDIFTFKVHVISKIYHMSAIPYPGGLLAAILCATRPCKLDKYIVAAKFKTYLAACGTTRATRGAFNKFNVQRTGSSAHV